MKHILFATLLTAAAMAIAEEAPRYDLTCGADVIGEAFHDGDELVVTVDEGATCEGTLAIDGLDVTVEWNEDGVVVVVVPETGEGTGDADDPDTKDGATDDESSDETPETDDEDATDPEGDDEDEVAEEDDDASEGPLEPALTGLDRADEAAGEHGRHGRDVARAAQGLDVDGDDADVEDDHDDEDADGASADAEVEVDVEVGIGLD